MKTAKRIIKIVLVVLLALLLVVSGYLAYVAFSYTRIEDRQRLSVEDGTSSDKVVRNESYTIVTQNFGFGAYTPDFTFFMDGGKGSRAKSAESVRDCLEKAYDEIKGYSPDFVFLQEVDTDSTRSHHVNERAAFDEKFADYSKVFAVNYHSAYLMYPLFKPHGKSNSGMTTYSRYGVSGAVRRSFPVASGLSKFLDLDRCYSVVRVPCANGRDLVLYNVHSSAYGGSDTLRSAQMTMLFDDMKAEYSVGNYVVCGGDFNHDFTGASTKDLNGGESVDFGWAHPFPEELIPDGFSRCMNYNDGKINPTCRNCDVPYKEGNFTIIVDGFIVSDNVTVTSLENVVTGFVYSDHNPVVMKFKLK